MSEAGIELWLTTGDSVGNALQTGYRSGLLPANVKLLRLSAGGRLQRVDGMRSTLLKYTDRVKRYPKLKVSCSGVEGEMAKGMEMVKETEMVVVMVMSMGKEMVMVMVMVMASVLTSIDTSDCRHHIRRRIPKHSTSSWTRSHVHSIVLSCSCRIGVSI